MHGVVREYQLDPANVDEVIRRISGAVESVLQTIPGFMSYAINDSGGGRIRTYSVYEDATGTRESTRRAADWVRENIPTLLPSPTSVTEGELRIREVVGQSKFGVLRRYHVDPKNVNTIVTRAREGFLPIISSIPGFTSYNLLDAGDGTLLVLNGFTTRQAADESVRKAADWVRANLAQLVPNPPEVTYGDIRFFVRSASDVSSTEGERGRRRAA